MPRERSSLPRFTATLIFTFALAAASATMPALAGTTTPATYPVPSGTEVDTMPATLNIDAAVAQPKPSPTASGTVSAPTPAEPPQSSGASGRVPDRAGNRNNRKNYRLILEPALVQTENVGGDTVLCFSPLSHVGCTQPKTAVFPGDVLRFAGNARYFFWGKLALHYQRIAHTGISGRTYTNGVANYGGSSYDYEELESLEYDFSPLITAQAGWDYRARVGPTGAGDPTNATPRAKHGPFVSAGFRFGPNTRVGRTFTFSERVVFVDHLFQPAAQSTLAKGATDAGRKPEFTQTLYGNFPIYGQTKIVPFGGLEYYGTYFDNQQLSLTYRKVYGFAYRATNDLTYRVTIKNDQNYPNTGNVVHKSYMQLEVGYRFER